MLLVFLKGIFIGLLVAFPTGPVGFLTLRRSYLFGIKSAMYSAVGAILTDAFFAIVVGFGLRKIANFLIMVAPYATVAAGIILIGIAIRSVTHQLDLEHHEGENAPLKDITSSAFLNILNPTLIFSFTIMFTAMGMLQYVGNIGAMTTFIVGIAAGTVFFWYVVARLIGYCRRNQKDHYIQRANKWTGIILGIVGIGFMIISLVKFL